jgi:hypothetical protein
MAPRAVRAREAALTSVRGARNIVPMATRKTPPTPAENPGNDEELRAELSAMALALVVRARKPSLNGQELKELVRWVRVAHRGEPFAEKDREARARSLLIAYCMAHTGEGKLAARELKTTADRIVQGLADAMPDFHDRAQRAKPEIEAMIAAHALSEPMPRGRPRKLERLTSLMGKPDLDAVTRKLCVAMGWSEASPKSMDRQRRRKKK